MSTLKSYLELIYNYDEGFYNSDFQDNLRTKFFILPREFVDLNLVNSEPKPIFQSSISVRPYLSGSKYLCTVQNINPVVSTSIEGDLDRDGISDTIDEYPYVNNVIGVLFNVIGDFDGNNNYIDVDLDLVPDDFGQFTFFGLFPLREFALLEQDLQEVIECAIIDR